MDKPKFTPEPWEAPNLHDHALYLPIYGSDGKIIAHVLCKDGHDEKAEANAVLMKTAPKMYSELETLHKFLVQNNYEFAASCVDNILREARGELEEQK